MPQHDDGLIVPDLSWLPSRFAVLVAISLTVVLGIAFIPWWTERAALGVTLLGGGAALTLVFHVAASRQSRIIETYTAYRAACTGDATLHGLVPGVGRFPPEALGLIPAALFGAYIYSLLNGERPPLLTFIGVASLAVIAPAAIFAASWRSPRFRIQWFLMLATWSAAKHRQRHLLRAIENDPLFEVTSTCRTSGSS